MALTPVKRMGRTACIAVAVMVTWLSHNAALADEVREAPVSSPAGSAQLEKFAAALEAALVSDVPDLAKTFNAKQRMQLVKQQIEAARGAGLATEQGIASYVLGVLYAGPDFQKKSKELEKLLKSNLPEVRKAHAMNEWVNAIIGAPDNVAAADRKLKEALKLTEAWGQ